MTIRINYSILFVSDMDRSVAFYRDVVGIPLKFQSPEWTEFVTEGATLALHKGEPRSVDSANRSREEAGQCRAGFGVPDLDAFHARMIEHEVPCVQQPTETFGIHLAQYLDPDGLILSVSGACASA